MANWQDIGGAEVCALAAGCPSEIDIERGLKGCRSLDDAKKYYKEMRNRHEDIDLAACLLLPAKTHLLFAIPSLPNFLGFRDPREAEKVFKQATNLRNNLVHGRDVVHGFCRARAASTRTARLRDSLSHGRDVVEETSWTKPIDVVEKIKKVLHHYEANREEFKREFGAAKQKT
jgi:hypothetical protein